MTRSKEQRLSKVMNVFRLCVCCCCLLFEGWRWTLLTRSRYLRTDEDPAARGGGG